MMKHRAFALVAFFLCCKPVAEDCDDGKDNDQDGKFDCVDADCDADPACQGNDTGDTGDTGDHPEGKDLTVRWSFVRASAGGDTPLTLTEACALRTWEVEGAAMPDTPFEVLFDTPLGYNDWEGGFPCEDGSTTFQIPPESVPVGLAAPPVESSFTVDPRLVLQEGWGPFVTLDTAPGVTLDQSIAPLVLDVLFRIEGTCDDEADNDGDGNTDCLDTNCRLFDAACTGGPVEDCDNDGDDDGDSLVDCDDPDCKEDPDCAESPVEDCNNEEDDDGDTFVDCDDPDCKGDPACEPTITDLDGDGLEDGVVDKLVVFDDDTVCWHQDLAPASSFKAVVRGGTGSGPWSDSTHVLVFGAPWYCYDFAVGSYAVNGYGLVGDDGSLPFDLEGFCLAAPTEPLCYAMGSGEITEYYACFEVATGGITALGRSACAALFGGGGGM